MGLNEIAAEERQYALEQLVAQGDERAVEVIGTALWDSHWPACDAFAVALAQIGGVAARAQLARALKARRHHIRSAAVRALATLSGPGAREAIQALADDPSYVVRQDVGAALHCLPCGASVVETSAIGGGRGKRRRPLRR